MRFIALTIAATLVATSVSATPRNLNTNINHQGQAQGQAQGQIQGQGQLQGQSQSANNRNSVNVEGGVSVGLGAASCADGFGIGIPGAGALSFALTNKNCRIVAEAQALHSMGFTSLAVAHLTQIGRIADTVRAVQGAGGATGATVVSTRAAVPAAPVVPLEVSCVTTEAGIQPQVTRAVMDAYTTAEIVAACR